MLRRLNPLLGRAALLFLCLGSLEARAAILAGPFINPANHHGYLMFTASSWTDAEAEAVAMGGHLATVRSLAENNWLRTTFQPFASDPIASLLIGLTDAAHEGTFRWVSGEPVTFTNWGAGEPNNSQPGAGEDYTNLLFRSFNLIQPGQWNDITNSSSSLPNYGVAEFKAEPGTWVPEPSTFISFFSVALILGARRRTA